MEVFCLLLGNKGVCRPILSSTLLWHKIVLHAKFNQNCSNCFHFWSCTIFCWQSQIDGYICTKLHRITPGNTLMFFCGKFALSVQDYDPYLFKMTAVMQSLIICMTYLSAAATLTDVGPGSWRGPVHDLYEVHSQSENRQASIYKYIKKIWK